VALTVANRAVRREVGATQCEVKDGVLKIEMSLAWGCRHQFCATFLQTECAGSAGRGGGKGQDWSEHEKKWHSLGEVRTVGERGLCHQHPMVVLDGFRQVGHHEILLNAMLKIAQCQGIDVELPLQQEHIAHLIGHDGTAPDMEKG